MTHQNFRQKCRGGNITCKKKLSELKMEEKRKKKEKKMKEKGGKVRDYGVQRSRRHTCMHK